MNHCALTFQVRRILVIRHRSKEAVLVVLIAPVSLPSEEHQLHVEMLFLFSHPAMNGERVKFPSKASCGTRTLLWLHEGYAFLTISL